MRSGESCSDSLARTPLNAKVVTDEFAALTTIVVSRDAPKNRVAALAKCARVMVAPAKKSKIKNQKSEIDLRWLMKKLGAEQVTNILVEGGGEVNASFLLGGWAHLASHSFMRPAFWLAGIRARGWAGKESSA